MTIDSTTVIALLPYLGITLLVGAALFIGYIRLSEYWNEDRPWILGIKEAKRRGKRQSRHR